MVSVNRLKSIHTYAFAMLSAGLQKTEREGVAPLSTEDNERISVVDHSTAPVRLLCSTGDGEPFERVV